MASRKSTTPKPSIEIPARRIARKSAGDPSNKSTRDAEFDTLLRYACLKAAGVGALSALAGAIPGAGTLLRFALGEIADVAALTAIQEALIEDTLALYGLPLPDHLRKPLVKQITMLGAGASVSVDALSRRLLTRFAGKLGVIGPVIGRIAPVAAVLTSALGNAATTYAIGRRAQAFAKLGEAPLDNISDAIRAFTGVDERKLWEWSVTATRDALARVSGVLSRVGALNPFAAKSGRNEEPAPEPEPFTAKPARKRAKAAKKATTRKSRGTTKKG